MHIRLICLLTVVLYAGSATAAPITYFFSSGSAKITATAGTTTIVDTTIALNGSFVTFDTDIPAVTDFEFTAGQSSPITMVNSYGGFDTFVIESAIISTGVGFSNPSATYSNGILDFVAGPVDVEGVYSASHTSGTPPPVSNLSAPFVGTSFLNGTVDTDLLTFELLGITLTRIAGAGLGEADDLIVKADVTWIGTVVQTPPVPEPGTATLLGFGLAGMALRRKRTSRGNG
jgi:hypothetical protein